MGPPPVECGHVSQGAGRIIHRNTDNILLLPPAAGQGIDFIPACNQAADPGTDNISGKKMTVMSRALYGNKQVPGRNRARVNADASETVLP